MSSTPPELRALGPELWLRLPLPVGARGMRETEMEQIAALMTRVLAAPDDDRVIGMVKTEVEQLCRQFPLYGERLVN